MSTESKTVEHVDEKRLEVDTPYRIEFLGKFMGFTEADISTIHQSAYYLQPLIPDLVTAVYDKLFSFDATKRHFIVKHHGFPGDPPLSLDELKINHAQMEFRRQHLAKYLAKLVSCEYDRNMLLYLDWVGKIHTSKAGNPEIIIPIVQIDAMFGFINDALITTIQSFPINQEKRTAMIRSFTKLLWIQADLFNRHYVAC